MIGRASRAIHRHGIAGVARILWQRARPAAHLSVAVEMARNPRHARMWLQDRLSGKSPVMQNMPWIAMPCIDFLDSYLRPGQKVLEWGGGGSTMYFLRRGAFLTTVESSPEWVQDLSARVEALPGDCRSRWDLRVAPAANNDDPRIAGYIDQVNHGGPWDVVLVDGWSRFKCLLEARSAVKTGGVLVLDNANQSQFREVPAILNAWERHAFRGLGVARTWVTQTDAYVRTSPGS